MELLICQHLNGKTLSSLFTIFIDIEVPTVNNVRNSELIGMILYNEDNVLCVGPTGTGKTLTVIEKLSKNMHKKFICDFFSFSARTTANQTQVPISFNQYLIIKNQSNLFHSRFK